MRSLEAYQKAFNLSDSCGPSNSALEIIKIVKGPEIDYVILKKREMVLYPPKSYGKTKLTYLTYACYGDAEKIHEVIFVFRHESLKALNAYLKELKNNGLKITNIKADTTCISKKEFDEAHERDEAAESLNIANGY